MYNHANQYRCTIIRGKSQKEMDDLLPAYAKVINEICPCEADNFEALFNNAFSKFLPVASRIKKTLDNHRTEISGKLFGMYYFSDDGNVYESDRTKKFLEDNDQPAFFKDICYKMQFPNGMQKCQTVQERIHDKISIRPNSFVLRLLLAARTANIEITKKDIGYYVLNSLDVLQGKATPFEVLETIAKDKNDGIERLIVVPGKASSYTYQHINEQLNYLELANLIRITDDKRVSINPKELKSINLIADNWDKPPAFDVYQFDLSSVEARKVFQFEWDAYYAKLSDCVDSFTTAADALLVEENAQDNVGTDGREGTNRIEFGDEGEDLIYNYEKKRVSSFNPRLANKVLSLGKTKGLGYDIQSVVAEPGDFSEFVKYIEVKSTKRLTVPDISDALWIDTLNITRNEYVAAMQHGIYYSIFRVYFTRNGVTVFVLSNVAEKLSTGKVHATPMTYRIDFSNASVDKVFTIN